jgi:Arc/MetJ family transcription regulator
MEAMAMTPDEYVVDPDLLATAQQALGTSGATDTLERALALAIQQSNRQQAAEAELARLGAGRYRSLVSWAASRSGDPR